MALPNAKSFKTIPNAKSFKTKREAKIYQAKALKEWYFDDYQLLD